MVYRAIPRYSVVHEKGISLPLDKGCKIGHFLLNSYQFQDHTYCLYLGLHPNYTILRMPFMKQLHYTLL